MSPWEKVRNAVDVFDVASAYGLPWAKLHRTQQVRCPSPDHSDRTASARVYVRPDEEPSIYCFTCQEAFDAIDLAASLEEIGRGAALHMLARRYGVNLEPDPEEAEARELISRWEHRHDHVDDERTGETVRAAGLVRRVAGIPWELAHAFLANYEQLDLTTITPSQWVRDNPLPSPDKVEP